MRTTVRLDDDLLRNTKAYAASRGMTLTAVLDVALRRLLLEVNSPNPTPIQLPVFGEGGLRPGVDLDNNVALLDLMDS